jgi:nitrate reductase beta subunit
MAMNHNLCPAKPSACEVTCVTVWAKRIGHGHTSIKE